MNDWFSDEKATFGDRLAGAREAAGLSQSELAAQIGVTVRTVQAWEEDRAEPRANRMQMLAGIANVSLMWLLNGEGEGVAEPTEAERSPPVPGIDAAVVDLRKLRDEMTRLADQAGRMEARLRRIARAGRG